MSKHLALSHDNSYTIDKMSPRALCTGHYSGGSGGIQTSVRALLLPTTYKPVCINHPAERLSARNVPMVHLVKDMHLCDTPGGCTVPDVHLPHPLKEAGTRFIEITLH